VNESNIVEDSAKALLVQKDQLDKTNANVFGISSSLGFLKKTRESNSEELEFLLSQTEELMLSSGLSNDEMDGVTDEEMALFDLSDKESAFVQKEDEFLKFISVDTIDPDQGFSDYFSEVSRYAARNDIDLSNDPFKKLLSPSQRREIEKRIRDDYTLKPASCDKYDYMIAATCGAIGGVIDVFFVGIPGQSKLGSFTDKQANRLVEKFATACGWKGGRNSKNSTKSATGFLERKFRVNYDQTTSVGKNGTDGKVKNLSMKNHHVKSLSHSPDIMGLFFSILNQFTNTSSFVSKGKVVTVETKSFELRGSTFVSKLYCGFFNWLGHLFSDLSGSSGSKGRGAGIPIPFYSLLQFVEVGSFGQHKQTFATVAVKVFENEYDLRHGAAMAIPVAITDLLIRLMWSVKSHFYHKKNWENSMPFGNIPELRRMLLVGHVTLCLIDTGDAAARSGGNCVALFLRMNLIGWVRFGHLGLKEARAIFKQNALDIESFEKDLDDEMKEIYKDIVG